MKKSILVLFLVSAAVPAVSADVFFAGRGASINASYWQVARDKVLFSDNVAEPAELFACALDTRRTRLYLGGAMNNHGMVWERDTRKDAEVQSSIPPESRVIYTLVCGPNDTLYAGGIHRYLGGMVWKKAPGGEWIKLGHPRESSMIACLAVDSRGRLLAGGYASSQGMVWSLQEGQWNRGTALNQCREINTLTVSGERVYAAGVKSDHSGGLWIFDGGSWNMGDNLKFSVAIYDSTVDPDGTIYLVGAGNENKVLWENSQGFWNAVELKDCLALYTIHSDAKGNCHAAGWNRARTGRAWYKPRKKDWGEGFNIEQCFVIRRIG
jgi:hypothetical protein